MNIKIHDYERQPGGFTHCVTIEHGGVAHIVFLHKDGWFRWMDTSPDGDDGVVAGIDDGDHGMEGSE